MSSRLRLLPSVVMLLCVLSSVSWAALNDAPSSLDMMRFEPCAGDAFGPVLDVAEQVALDQGYLVYSRIDYNTLQGAPVCKVSRLKTDLYNGCGLWLQSSHGSPEGFVAEMWGSMTPDTAAYNNYLRNGYTSSDLLLATVGTPNYPTSMWCIQVTPSWVARNFYSWQSIVFDGTCYSLTYANWPRARAVLGYPSACPSASVGYDADFIFRNLNGQNPMYATKPQTRILSEAVKGASVSTLSGSQMNTVLSPTIRDFTIPDTISQRMVANVRFDCPMDRSVHPWQVIQGDGIIELANWSWVGDDKLQFTLIGRQTGLPGTIRVIPSDPFTGMMDGARTDAGQIPMDGNGIGPNRDQRIFRVSSKYVDTGLAANILGYLVTREGVDVRVTWSASAEGETRAYLLEHAPTGSSDYSLITRVEAGHGEYVVIVPSGEDGNYRLREIEVFGDTLQRVEEPVGNPVTIDPSGGIPELVSAYHGNEQRSSAQLTQEAEQALSGGVYDIFTTRMFMNQANALRDFWNTVGYFTTNVVFLEDIGGAAGLKPYVNAHSEITSALIMASCNDSTDVYGTVIRNDPTMWNTMGFGPKPPYTSQGKYNLCPLYYSVDPDSMRLSMSYWTRYWGTILPYFDRNGNGKPDDNIRFGLAPVRDTTQARGFVEKVKNAWNMPALTKVGSWGYFRSGTNAEWNFALAQQDARDQLVPPTMTVAKLRDTYLSVMTTQQRITQSLAAINEGRAYVDVGSNVNSSYSFGAFLPKDQGCTVAQLAPNPTKPTFILGSCGNGNVDQTDNPTYGTGMMMDMLFAPDRGAWGVWAPNKGSWGSDVDWMKRKLLAKLFSNPVAPRLRPIGDVTNEVVCAFIDSFPSRAAMGQQMMNLFDPNLILRLPGGTTLSTDTPQSKLAFGISPNPASLHFSISFELDRPATVSLDAYDISGRRVAGILHGTRQSGRTIVAWNGSTDRGLQLAPGLYIVRFATNTGYSAERKVVVLR